MFMNRQFEPSGESEQNNSLRFLWSGLTAVFAVLLFMAFFEWRGGEAPLDRALLPASMLLLGIINVFTLKGALRSVLLALMFVFVVSSYAMIYSR